VDRSVTAMKSDFVTKLLLLTIAVLLSLNLLTWNRPTTASAQAPEHYKMLVLPVNAGGIRVFEEETNQNNWKMESLQVGGQSMVVAILKK
jgi:hypothetical protein